MLNGGMRMGKFIDLTGQRFGRLTVLKRAKKPDGCSEKNKKTYWSCVCDCGKEVVKCADSLKIGDTKSCGCLRENHLPIGMKIGLLKIIAIAEKPEFKRTKGRYYLCTCDCGKDKIVSEEVLKQAGENISCGCKRIELMKKVGESGFIDLTGQRFERFVVIKLDHIDKVRGAYWLCVCDCGNKKVVTSANLKSGTKSCGCYIKEISSINNRKGYGEAAYNTLFLSYRTRANRLNYDFEFDKVTFKEITQQNCFYCGSEPKQISKVRFDTGVYIYNGIDRVDSLKGYTIENSVPCCGQCNIAKLNHRQEDFYEWIERTYKNLILKKIIGEYEELENVK
jgi:hypothetical protein